MINGLSYTPTAPFDRNHYWNSPTTGNSYWVWNVDYVTPPLDGSRLKGDVKQMYNPTGVFEDTNLPSEPSKVVLWHNGKYYLIYLQDANNKPYQIKRNYEYKIIIDKLDETAGDMPTLVCLEVLLRTTLGLPYSKSCLVFPMAMKS